MPGPDVSRRVSEPQPTDTSFHETGMSRLLAEDLRHMVEPHGSPLRWRAEVCAKVVLYPRVRAVVYYRWSQALARRGLMPLAAALQARAIRGSGAELAPHADLGPGLCLMHSVGIVVGPEVVAGRNLRLYHGVTLGDGRQPGQPRLGDDVTIGTGASLLGGITIGDRVIVGAHSVVTRDVPDDSVVVGAPATARPRDSRHAHYAREDSLSP